jgi:uncharacterized protein
VNKELIKKIILENQERIPGLTVFAREMEIPDQTCCIITGPRRAGKTYLIYLKILSLLEKGTPVQNILYINFEDERLIGMNVSGLDMILESYKELFTEKPFIFLDEIQNIEGWQKFARRLADTGYTVVITGSNAKMLSGEMASTLGARYLAKEIDTLSFSEFLGLRNVRFEEQAFFSSQRFELQHHFDDYLKWGGFPELLHAPEQKEYLSNIFQKIFLGDIIARYQIRNPAAMQLMIKKLAESTMDEISFSRIRNILQSIGIQVGTATLIEYMRYFEEAFLIRSLANYRAKITERESKKKYYFRDHGLLSLFLADPDSFLLECAVFNTLKRKHGNNLYYLRNNFEVDFFIPDLMALQVAHSITDEQTKKREVAALIKTCETHHVDNLTIVTKSEEETIEDKKFKINVVPAWKWMLTEERPSASSGGRERRGTEKLKL